MASRPRRSAASTATGSATSTPSGTPKGTPNKTKAVSSGSTSASGTPRSSARKRVASHSSTPSKSTPSKSTPTSKSNGKTNGSSSSKTGTKTKARKEVKRSSPAIIFKDDLESEEETTPSVDEDDSEDEYRDEEGAGGKGADGEDDDDDEDEEFDDDEDDDEEDDDDDDDYGGAGGKRSKARGKPIAKARPVKKRKKLEDDEDDEDDAGMTEVIEVVAAPREKISKGRVSPHLVGFLKSLKDPAKNDRDWFARHKNIYDYIYANWLQFVEAATEEFMEHVDDTIPWLPPKDLIERIYRDVRFSNDKTPYKTHLSMCLSRNGRKGNFGKYYLSVSPGSSSLNAGCYEPSKEELQMIRDHILTNSAHGLALRRLVEDKTFCKYFGNPPKKGAKPGGNRTSLWNSFDELKTAPKGFPSNHEDIVWLRLKHFTVSHKFKDEDVVSEKFMSTLLDVARAAKPLVDLINEMFHGADPEPNA